MGRLSGVYRATRVYMDTFVTVEVVGGAADEAEPAAERAFAWFAEVESSCSRFDPESELRRLTARPGEPVAVSPVLFEAARFALEVARASRGAFDPTVGGAQEARGFDRNFRTGRHEPSGLAAGSSPGWRQVRLDAQRRTITLQQPLLLDLGGVAKGLAIDLAARELAGFPGFVVEAGGDLLAHGGNAEGEPWRIGIRHPRQPEAVCTLLGLRDAAVCTSGDYERRTAGDVEHHLLDPRTQRSPAAVASCSVVAPGAMLADALSTAASVLGPEAGPRWLERQGVEGLFITPALEMRTTRGFARYEACLR